MQNETSSAGDSEHLPSATKKKLFVITNVTPTKARSTKELVSRLPSVVSDFNLEEGNPRKSEVWAIEKGLGLPLGSDIDPLEHRDTEVSHITLDYGVGHSRPLWAMLQPSNCVPPPLPQLDPVTNDLKTSAKGDAASRTDEPEKPASLLSCSSLAPWHSASQCDTKDTARNMPKPTASHFFASYKPDPVVEISEAPISANRAKGDDCGHPNSQNWSTPLSVSEACYADVDLNPEAFAARHTSDRRASPPPSSIVSFDSLQLALRLHEAEDKSALIESDGMGYPDEDMMQPTFYGLDLRGTELPDKIPTYEQRQGHSDNFQPNWFFSGAGAKCDDFMDVACDYYPTRAEERDLYHFTSDPERFALLDDLNQDDRSDILIWSENASVEENYPEFFGDGGIGVYCDSDEVPPYFWRGYPAEPDTYASFCGLNPVDDRSYWTQLESDDAASFARDGTLSTASQGSEPASRPNTASSFDTLRPGSDQSMEEPLGESNTLLDGIRSEKRLDGGGVLRAEVDVAKTLRDHWFPQKL